MSMYAHAHLVVAGLTGQYGTVGLYGALQRLLLAFTLAAAPLSCFIDAPFGRFGSGTSSRWACTVSGVYGWLVMELVAPVAYLVGVSAPVSTSSSSAAGWRADLLPSLSSASAAFRCLPRARQILVIAFLVHYANRSLVSTWRNPSRARMHLAVPLSAILFNSANGFTMGMYVAGGFGRGAGHHDATALSGFRDDDARWARPLFWIGIAVWLIGFASNIYHDEVLYALKRRQPSPSPSPSSPKPGKGTGRAEREREGGDTTTTAAERSRYSIPPRTKGLYRLISYPSYLSEWIEWTGYFLATLSLGPSPFPSHAATLVFRSAGSNVGRRLVPLPPELKPFGSFPGNNRSLILPSPPALFVLLEIALMLPRATRGHKWYERTFGPERWRTQGQRWVVVPHVW